MRQKFHFIYNKTILFHCSKFDRHYFRFDIIMSSLIPMYVAFVHNKTQLWSNYVKPIKSDYVNTFIIWRFHFRWKFSFFYLDLEQRLLFSQRQIVLSCRARSSLILVIRMLGLDKEQSNRVQTSIFTILKIQEVLKHMRLGKISFNFYPPFQKKRSFNQNKYVKSYCACWWCNFIYKGVHQEVKKSVCLMFFWYSLYIILFPTWLYL